MWGGYMALTLLSSCDNFLNEEEFKNNLMVFKEKGH
jgi:hypothetical protein